MSSSDTANHINVRRRISSYEAELVARSRELLARAEALLRQDVPTTFLGERRNPSLSGRIGNKGQPPCPVLVPFRA
jgi:hypothetical protein